MDKGQVSHSQSDKQSLKLRFVNKEVFLENKRILPRQAYKRRKILHILIKQTLDRADGNSKPAALSIEDLVKLLKLTSNYDLETHLLRPLRSLSKKLEGMLVSIKVNHTTLFFLDVENIKIEIG